MDPEKQKEEFSNAFFHASASVAGVTVAKPQVDDDSIDWTMSEKGGGGLIKSPKLDVQLKCTAKMSVVGEAFHFALKAKNYNELIPENVMVPRILVVVIVPQSVDEWLEVTADHLLLRHCAYWKSLRGHEAKENTSSVTVQVPLAQRFDANAVRSLFSRLREGHHP